MKSDSGVIPSRGRKRAKSGASARSVPADSASAVVRRRSNADEREKKGRFTNERSPSTKKDAASSGVRSTCRRLPAAGAQGVGGSVASLAARRGTARGAPSHVFVGRVRNLGKGVWGIGSVIGWIPADVCPWNWAKRMGWKQIFSRRTGPLVRTRPYVLGDDGRYHMPERWEEV